MSGIRDVQLRAPITGVELWPQFATDPPSSVTVVCNDPSVTPTTIILRESLVGDGVPSHRSAALVGLRAETIWNNPLWGQLATTSQGALVPVVNYLAVNDSFTGTNGTVLSAHVAEIGGPMQDVLGAGTEASIQSNRARGKGTGFGPYYGLATFYFGDMQPTLPFDQNGLVVPYWIEAVLFRRATLTGVGAGVISEGISFEMTTGGDSAYIFGWCEADDTWYLNEKSSGVESTFGSSVVNAFTGTSQSRTLRVYVQEVAGEVDVICQVDGTTVITQNITTPDFIGYPYPAIYFNASGSVDIDSWFVNGNWMPLAGMTATATPHTFPGFNVVVPLTGFQVPATANRLYPPSADQPLTGKSLTTTGGKMVRWLGIDTFTGSNNTLLGAHTADTGQAWTKENSSGTVGDPWIQSNRLQSQNGEYNSLWYIGTDTPINSVVQGDFRYAGPSDGDQPQSPHEGIGARIQIGSGANADGYFFGFSVYFGGYWTLWKRQGGVDTELAFSSLPYSYTGTESHTIKMEVYGGDDVDIFCYLDDVQVIAFTDTAANTPLGIGAMGVWLGQYDNSSTGFTREWTINTFWFGDAGDGNLGRLIGQVATLSEGVLTGVASGGGAGATLAGLALALSQGTMIPYDHPIGELVGNVVAGSAGLLHNLLGIGVTDPSAVLPLQPKLDGTTHTYSSGNWYRPSNLINQPYAVGGRLKASGWEYLPVFTPDGSRRGGIYADQIAKVWTGLEGTAIDEIFADGTEQDWPRNFVPIPPYVGKYSYFYYTTHSVDPYGGIHTGAQRLNEFTDYIPKRNIFGWQHTDITTDRYNGPEVAEYALGFYAFDPVRAAVFYATRGVAVAPNVEVEMSQLKATTHQGFVGVTNVGDGSTSPLNGAVATAIPGLLVRDSAESGVSGFSASLMLDPNLPVGPGGYPQGQLRTTAGTIVGVSDTDNTYLALRTCTAGDMEWSRELRFGPPTGAKPSRLIRAIVPIPSGHPDIFFVAYASDVKVGLNYQSDPIYDTYIGLAVVNIRTRLVLSNNNYYAYTLGGLYTTNTPKAVADVLRQLSGKCFTQFILQKQIVNVAWQDIDITPASENVVLHPQQDTTVVLRSSTVSHLVSAPVLTFKTPPPTTTVGSVSEGPLSGAEAFEMRGDLAYHVLYQRVLELVSVAYVNMNKLYVNDITLPSSEWTTIAAVDTGADELGYPEGHLMKFAIGPFFYGSGGGDPSVLFQSGGYLSGPGDDHSWEIWDTFWNNQPTFFSVSAAVRVGHVSITNTPNAQLSGFRLTTNPGLFTGIYSGPDISYRLVGRKATTSQGILEPPKVTFLLDTFTDTDGTVLTAHTGEFGATWANSAGTGYTITSNVIFTTVAGSFNRAWASGVSPTRDYKISANVSPTSSGTHNGANIPEIAIGVRCDDGDGLGGNTNGYFLGYHPVYQRFYIFKPNTHGEPNVLYSWDQSSSGTNPWSIEVNGVNPTRITARFNGVVQVVVDDYGYQYYDPGHVTVYTTGFSASVGAVLDINGTYYDPAAFFLDGLRAFTSQGVMTGPWPTGQVAYTQQGVLTPSIGGVDAALTGLSVTGTQGVIFPAQAEAVLSGLSLTATGGLLTPATTGAVTWGLIGIRIFATAGIASLLNRELFGLRVDVRRGDMGQVVDGSQGVAGMVLVVSNGLLKVYVNPALLGLGSTGSSGVVKPADGATEAGQMATTGAGFLMPSTAVIVPLTGLAASVAGGVLQPSVVQASGTAGQAATAGIGTLVPVISKGLAGSSCAVANGTFVPLIVVTPLGRQAVTAEGTLQIIHNIALTGQSGTLVQGVIAQQHGCTLYPSGLEIHCEVGDVTRTMQKDEFEEDLFFTSTLIVLNEVKDETDAFVTMLRPP